MTTISVTLGPRLQTVASLVPEGADLGDIGTDHAYLPIALYETQKISKAIAVDVHEGPYQSALNAVQTRHLEAFIDVRFGDGLMPLKSGDVDTLTLAGMGGRTMLEILFARPDVMESVTDLILQPQGAEGALRLALLESGWHLKEERLVKEEERIYGVIAFSKEKGRDIVQLKETIRTWILRLDPLQKKLSMDVMEFENLVARLVWHFGPFVLEQRTDLLSELLNEYSGMLQRRIKQMKKSKSPGVMTKINEVSNEIMLVEGLQIWR